jgi:dTDP-4-amino-4,6-dideoxygalactose transaminase
MIPLIRPQLPSIAEAQYFFAASQKAGVYSNFGPCHEGAVQRLSDIMQANTLPVTNGTAAIEVALLSIGLPKAARVLVPDFTHVGTLLAVTKAGFTPVLARVHRKSWVLDIDETVDAWIRGVIDAVVVVNPFGYGVDLAGWEQAAHKHKIPLVYDFAAAWGWFPSVQNPVAYSFHATKNMAIGEGGCVVFPDETSYGIGRRLVNFDTLLTRDIGSTDGYNYKMDELRCAMLLAALSRGHQQIVDARITRKRRILDTYMTFLKDCHAPTGRFTKPSLCVLGGLPARELEAAGPTVGMVFRRYYPLLSRMTSLETIERISVSPDYMESCCALPADVELKEAFEVVNVLKKFIGGAQNVPDRAAPRP